MGLTSRKSSSLVLVALREMMKFTEVEGEHHLMIIAAVSKLQLLANEFNVRIFRIYGIAGHEKNEVDSVGGSAKIALSTGTARKNDFFNAGD